MKPRSSATASTMAMTGMTILEGMAISQASVMTATTRKAAPKKIQSFFKGPAVLPNKPRPTKATPRTPAAMVAAQPNVNHFISSTPSADSSHNTAMATMRRQTISPNKNFLLINSS